MTSKLNLTTTLVLTVTVLLIAAIAAMASAPLASAADCKGADKPAYELRSKQARKATLCLLNKARAEKGLKKLKEQKQARKAAARHNRQMLKKNCFDHRCPGEPDLGGRFDQAGYTSCGCSWSAGENIAWGQGSLATPRSIVKSWMNSSGHRANVLNGSFRHIGIGIHKGAPNGGGSDHATYTTTFGARS